MRYLPCQHLSNDMFGWHHDMEEKRFKIMVLLTDVPVGGQHMSYVLGSHRARHPHSMFFRNACPLEYCASYLPEIRIFDAIGRAGDVFVFDSNGAHRGNRRPEGPLREVFMLEYTADSSHIWGGDLPAEFAASLPTEADHPFRRFMQAEKAWEKPARRKSPSWVENLPNIRRWL